MTRSIAQLFCTSQKCKILGYLIFAVSDPLVKSGPSRCDSLTAIRNFKQVLQWGCRFVSPFQQNRALGHHQRIFEEGINKLDYASEACPSKYFKSLQLNFICVWRQLVLTSWENVSGKWQQLTCALFGQTDHAIIGMNFKTYTAVWSSLLHIVFLTSCTTCISSNL